MKVTILGNNSALPAHGRHPSCQIVSLSGVDLMLDCGEGAQLQMQHYGIKWRNLEHIFISHLHGDHYFGLPGLINSMNLLGRTTPLHLYGPAPLEPIVRLPLEVADTTLGFPFFFHAIPAEPTELLDTPIFSVSSFPVEHRIACYGFLISQKTSGRKLLPEACQQYNIPTTYFEQLKKGEDFITEDGERIENHWVTTDGPPPKRYAYCADTLFTDSFLPYINGADLMYHEATYLNADAAKAARWYHSTAAEAAMVAVKANVKQLLIGHFSSKYKELTEFLTEAAAVFPNVRLAEEGMSYEIGTGSDPNSGYTS